LLGPNGRLGPQRNCKQSRRRSILSVLPPRVCRDARSVSQICSLVLFCTAYPTYRLQIQPFPIFI
jgi:hypothetical protein